jgi:hypothetical protein
VKRIPDAPLAVVLGVAAVVAVALALWMMVKQ